MLMSIWVFMLMSEGMVQVRCAPKLGHVLFDPLSYEAQQFKRALTGDLKRNEQNENKSLIPRPSPAYRTAKSTEESTMTPLTTSQSYVPTSYDKVVASLDTINLYQNSDSETIKQLLLTTFLRTQDEGNQLNIKNCTVNPYRILCGYDKNIGISDYDEVIDLGKGCRMHNDRIECHYLQPPYVNLRRPPPNDYETNSTQLRAAIEIENVERCSDCSTKDPNEAIPSEMVKLLSVASNPNSKLLLKSNVQEADDPEQFTPQETNDASGEFWTPIPQTVHSKLKSSMEEPINVKSLFIIPVSILSSTPAENSVTWSQLAAETMPRIIKANKIKDQLESVDNTQPNLDFLSKLMKQNSEVFTSVEPETKETQKSDPLPVMFSDGKKVPESLSLLVGPTQKSDGLYVSEAKIPSFIESPETTLKKYNDPENTSDFKYRFLRSAGRTPKIMQIQTSVTRKKRWCVEKGDRIVCYYSNNN